MFSLLLNSNLTAYQVVSGMSVEELINLWEEFEMDEGYEICQAMKSALGENRSNEISSCYIIED